MTTVISFYTNDWEYPAHAKRMHADCLQLGLTPYIIEKQTTTDYIKNTAIKPFFIKECLDKFKSPVLWVDVDGLLLQAPDFSQITEDFAATEYANPDIDRDWAVSIMWFNYTPAAIALVDKWCEHAVSGTDEAAFDIAWKQLRDSVSAATLPAEYCFNKWRDSLEIPPGTVFCNQLSKSPDKMRRKYSDNG